MNGGRMVAAHSVGCAVATLLLLAGPTIAAPAINQFEVKDLQSSPGAFEFQSQNAFSTGQPRRQTTVNGAGDTVYDDNTVIRQREALEIQLGITDYFRIRLGVEFEQERLDDPGLFADPNAFSSLKIDEVAVEAVIVFVKPQPNGVGLGLLIEYGAPVNGGRDSQSELYLGPIIEAHAGRWSLIANLAFVRHIGGSPAFGEDDFIRDEKWDFCYFLQGQLEVSDSWALALEAYGTFDRLGDSGRRSESARLFGDFDQHRAGPVAYYTIKPQRFLDAVRRNGVDADGGDVEISIGAGALFGLNENTPDTTYKLSLEVEY